jgi:ArsR family transcriptional regulator
MLITKVEDITQIYKALSEEMRLRILMLLTQGELCVCDIMAVLDEPQSKVSRHLAYLKHSGLIQGKRVGTWMHYFLKDPLNKVVSAHLEFLKNELSRLDWARADVEKMLAVQAQKLCENSTGNGSPSRGRGVSNKKRAKKKRKK